MKVDSGRCVGGVGHGVVVGVGGSRGGGVGRGGAVDVLAVLMLVNCVRSGVGGCCGVGCGGYVCVSVLMY